MKTQWIVVFNVMNMQWIFTVNYITGFSFSVSNIFQLVLLDDTSGVAKVGNGWAQAQPIMSSAQPIFMSIVQPIYTPFHVKIYNK